MKIKEITEGFGTDLMKSSLKAINVPDELLTKYSTPIKTKFDTPVAKKDVGAEVKYQHHKKQLDQRAGDIRKAKQKATQQGIALKTKSAQSAQTTAPVSSGNVGAKTTIDTVPIGQVATITVNTTAGKTKLYYQPPDAKDGGDRWWQVPLEHWGPEFRDYAQAVPDELSDTIAGLVASGKHTVEPIPGFQQPKQRRNKRR